MIEFLVFSLEGCAVVLDALGWLLEGIARRKSKANRLARKEAKRKGEPVPKRTRWGMFATGFGMFMIVITLLILAWFWLEPVAQ